jgi:alkylated DNA repair dioxygenase AlkB
MWSYYPGIFKSIELKDALAEISPLTEQNRSRFSCGFVSDGITLGYGMPEYPWEKSPITVRIKDHIERYCLQGNRNVKFDYCLAHIYLDGNSTIAWHNDKEALYEEIFSVSLGQRRKFRLRKLEATSGWDAEYPLGEGDLLHMHKGCQLNYKHCVPKETTVTETRISWTFRKIDRLQEVLGL